MEEVETGQTVKAAADRILNLMDGALPGETPDASHPEPAQAEGESPETEQEPELEAAQEAEEPTLEPTEEAEPLTHFHELAEHLNVEEDFLENLVVPTKVNGQEVAPTIKDLLSHYSKGESADQKLMDLAEARKKQEAEFSQKEEQLTQEMGRNQALFSELEALYGGDELKDLEAIRHTDPAEYSARIADRQLRMQKLDQIRNEMTQLQGQRVNEAYAKTVELEKTRLLSALPEWQDEKTAKTEQADLRNYLKDFGFKDEEIDGQITNGVISNYGIVDHRAIMLARKAMLYDKSMKTSEPKRAKLKSLPKVGSGIRKTKSDVKKEEFEEVRGRVRKTGDMKDAARAIEQLMMRGN